MFTITTNALDIAEKFLVASETIRGAMQPWDQIIIAEARDKIVSLYGEKLGALFEFDDAAAGGGELAHIKIWTDNPAVIGYEEGIKPHEIWAHHTALRFQPASGTDTIYRRMVHHPGTVGKHKFADFEPYMQEICERDWTEALTTVLEIIGND